MMQRYQKVERKHRRRYGVPCQRAALHEVRLEWRSWGAEQKHPTFDAPSLGNNLTSLFLLRCIMFKELLF